ncbi:MAG: hypothetical protein JSV41_01755 [Gemmatimonadota bacterium]|nr:MAG: hypothetical protein JSV41_01755 [Gemmatimonadota bacterium]
MPFDFGFGFLILFFVIFLGCGKMCGWGARKYKERQRELESKRKEEDRLASLESRVRRLDDRVRGRDRLPRPAAFRRGEGTDADAKEAEPARLRQRRRSPLQELQQKFIEGKLTLAEYERELDRLDRIE